MSKLLKAQKSAQKKVKSLREDLDGDELQSKEDKAALKKLEEAEKKAGEAIEFARSVERVKEGRNLSASFSSQSILARHKAGTLKGELKVLSASPLVATLDGWLGPEGLKALDDLPAGPLINTPASLCISLHLAAYHPCISLYLSCRPVLDLAHICPPSPPISPYPAVLEGLAAWPTAPADWNEEEDGVWQPDKKEAGELCVGKDEEGKPQAKMLQAPSAPVSPAISL